MDRQEWEQIKEEFGDVAFRRINVNNFECVGGNGSIDRLLDDDTVQIEVKPLPELFALDVEWYGKNAGEMWEWFLPDDDTWYSVSPSECDIEDFTYASRAYLHRRKTSAALPFDFERAKAGDDLERARSEIMNVEQDLING